MSLFVDPEKTFEILFWVRSVEPAGVDLSVTEPQEEGFNRVSCVCVGRDYESMSRVLEDSTIINHITGAPMVRTRTFYRGIATTFITKCEVDGSPAPWNNETVGKVHDDVVRHVARRWLHMTAGTKK